MNKKHNEIYLFHIFFDVFRNQYENQQPSYQCKFYLLSAATQILKVLVDKKIGNFIQSLHLQLLFLPRAHGILCPKKTHTHINRNQTMKFSCVAKATKSHSSKTEIELTQKNKKKNCQTIQKQRTRKKEVEQEICNNLSVTLLSQTPLISPGKMMTCRYILHA